MDDVQIERRLTTLEQSSQYMADQIVDMQSTQSEIRDLALSVNSLAGSVKRLVEDMCAANRRLDKIESAPGKQKLKDHDRIRWHWRAGRRGHWNDYNGNQVLWPRKDEVRKWNILWLKAAGIRALKTSHRRRCDNRHVAVLGDVNWAVVASASVLAGILSLLTSVAGLPELKVMPNENPVRCRPCWALKSILVTMKIYPCSILAGNVRRSTPKIPVRSRNKVFSVTGTSYPAC